MKIDGKKVNKGLHPTRVNVGRFLFVLTGPVLVPIGGVVCAATQRTWLIIVSLAVLGVWCWLAFKLYGRWFPIRAWETAGASWLAGKKKAKSKNLPLMWALGSALNFYIFGIVLSASIFYLKGLPMPVLSWLAMLAGSVIGGILARSRWSMAEADFQERGSALLAEWMIAGFLLGRLGEVWIETL